MEREDKERGELRHREREIAERKKPNCCHIYRRKHSGTKTQKEMSENEIGTKREREIALREAK